MLQRIWRRPSPATLIAVVALFVALGVPAQAARLITGAEIEDHSVSAVDLKRNTVSLLRRTPPRSVRSAQIVDGQVLARDLAVGAVTSASVADGSLTGADLAPGAVTASRLGAGSVSGAAIADGTLQTLDVGAFAGAVQVDFDTFVGGNTCQFAEFTPTPTGTGLSNIADDVVLVSPQAGWSDWVTVTAKPAANNQIRLVACDQPGDPFAPFNPGASTFLYVTFDSP